MMMLNSQIIQSAVIGPLMPNIIRPLPILLLLTALSHSCDPGGYSNQNGVCLQCHISCNTCSSGDGCDTCYGQMFLIAKNNKVVCEICYNINLGCDICITAQKCSSCLAGYYLQEDNTCANCDNLTPNCLLCQSENTTICLACLSPFRLINGQCQIATNSSDFQSTSNALAADSTQNIQNSNNACDASEVYINGGCYPAIAFCQIYSRSGGCITCNSLFLLSNGYCLPSTLVTSNSQIQGQSSGKDVVVVSDSSPPTSINSGASANLKNSSSLGPLYCDVLNPADPTQCQVCADGFAIFDAFPGVCFPIN